jgi:ParB/RepB/Spo0J family partition protein
MACIGSTQRANSIRHSGNLPTPLYATANASALPLECSNAYAFETEISPRIVFREEEMTELLESIKEVGIKVPVSLYQDGQHYVLIDGERRWRCSKKLNLKTMPAIVQPKPTRLENLLMMFNIHNVRVDWDPMPMALKLSEVSNLLVKAGQPNTAKALSAVTGVPLASVRRALDLLDLPQKYQKLLIREAAKPRNEQKVKADLFIEIYKSLHAIERHTPEVLEDIPKAEYIDVMVKNRAPVLYFERTLVIPASLVVRSRRSYAACTVSSNACEML